MGEPELAILLVLRMVDFPSSEALFKRIAIGAILFPSSIFDDICGVFFGHSLCHDKNAFFV